MAEREDNDNRGNALNGVAVTPVMGGMVQDTEIVNQPQGTYRYALNMVRETNLPKHIAICNERSNEGYLTTEHIDEPGRRQMFDGEYIIGCVGVGDEKFVLFTVSYVTPAQTPDMEYDPVSRIYIYDSRTGYVSAKDMVVDDSNSAPYDKLRFNEHHQIEALYRLRNGCERHVYWTDNLNVPRTMNIDKPYKYTDASGNPVASRFNLIKTYSKIPVFERKDASGNVRYGVEVLDGGSLMPGGYNVAVRFIDADSNATEWIVSTNTIVVSNSSVSGTEYQSMRGSTAKQSEWQKFGDSGKMIRASIRGDSIDTDYEYVQFGLVERNSGTGEDMRVSLSQPVMIGEDTREYVTCLFTGLNATGTEDVSSIEVNTMVVGRAKTIVENNSRLLLGNIDGKRVDWCSLQKYASKIGSRCVVKRIPLDDIGDPDCIASAIYNNEDVGYMPGEVYSFGIVYVFDDGSVSPVFHIPGPRADGVTVDGPLVDDYPMRTYECASARYTGLSGCGGGDDFWGVDYSGKPLAGSPVRHHRFPTRHDIGIRLVEQVEPSELPVKEETRNYVLYILAKDHYVDSVYERNYDRFVINVRLGFGSYDSANDEYESYRDVPVTIMVSDWNEAARNNKMCLDWNGMPISTYPGYFAVKLGSFDDTPHIVSLSEQPRTYIRSEGDSGTRYGWCTSGAHIKCKYKKSDGEWTEKDTANAQLMYPYEDGRDLGGFFYFHDKHPVGINSYENVKTRDNHRYFIKVNIKNYPDGWFNVSCVNWFPKSFRDNGEEPDNYRNNICHVLKPTYDFNIHGENIRYTVPILGIRFHNIEIPDENATGGNRIIGYHIVRNRRDDMNRTVLDSAVTLPVVNDLERGDTGASSVLSYNHANVSDNNVDTHSRAFINPEHLFLKRKHTGFRFVVDGKVRQNTNYDYRDTAGNPANCNGVIRNYDNIKFYRNIRFNGVKMSNTEEYSSADTDFILDDVQPGTSYDKSVNSSRDYDNDGFDMFFLIEEFNMRYAVLNGSYRPDSVTYLAPLDNMRTEDGKTLYNLSCDNAIGIMSSASALGGDDMCGEYGYMVRDNADAYSEFRTLPYYRDSKNMLPVPAIDPATGLSIGDSGEIYGGDVYVSPMRYVNSVFYDNKIKRRKRKKALWRIIGGIAGALTGAAAGVFVNPALGIAGITAGISMLTSGINLKKATTVYNKLYNSNLKRTFRNTDADNLFFRATHIDDQIQWSVEVLNSLWFESTVNMFWRNTVTADYPKPLDPLSHWNTDEYVRYMREKFTVVDSNQENGLLYSGFAKSELYDYNQDYLLKTTRKMYFALPYDHDCCIGCNDRFTHRIIYSEKSFFEERTDNYRKFLPMNYRDVDGIRGDITALVSHNNDVIVLCEEGSWGLILNTQPMVVGGIVSYLGTGDMFTVSPKPYVMACRHQFSIQRMNGVVMFVDVFNKCIWMYSSKQNSYGTYVASPDDIAQLGMRRFLFGELGIDEREYDDNPASIIGHGYVIGYDPELQRVMVTKRDVRLEGWRDGRFIEANGNLYDISSQDTTPPDSDTEHPWEYVMTDDDNGRIVFRRRKSFGVTFNVPDTVTPTTNGYDVISGVFYRIAYHDIDGNVLDDNALVALGIDISGYRSMSFMNCDACSVRAVATAPSAYQQYADMNIASAVVCPGYRLDVNDLYHNPRITDVRVRSSLDNDGHAKECDYDLYYDIDIIVDRGDAPVPGTVRFITEFYNCVNNVWTRITDPSVLMLTFKAMFDVSDSGSRTVVLPVDVYNVFGDIVIGQRWYQDTNVDDVNNISVTWELMDDNTGQQVHYNCIMDYVGGEYIFRFYIGDSCGEDPVPSEQCYMSVQLKSNRNETHQDAQSVVADFDSTMYITVNNVQYPITVFQYDDSGQDITVTFSVVGIPCSDIHDAGRDNISYHIFRNDVECMNAVESCSANVNVLNIVINNVYPNDIPADTQTVIVGGDVECVEGSAGSTTYTVGGDTYDGYEYMYRYMVPMQDAGLVNYGWTLSFHIPDRQWVSFHSYIPDMYFNNSERMFTVSGMDIWRHGVRGSFCRFYGTNRDCTIEYVSVENNGLVVKVWDDISLMADVVKFGQNGPYKITDKFFDKLLVWNTRQMSGYVDVIAKDSRNGSSYLIPLASGTYADCNEGVWSINGFRDNVVDYQKPMFIVDKDALQQDWFVDRKVNPAAITDAVTGDTKQWFNSERMRDRFMCVRLTKSADDDNVEQDVKYVVYLSEDDVTRSER